MRASVLMVCITATFMVAACGNKDEAKSAISTPTAMPPSGPAPVTADASTAPVAATPDVGKLEQVTVTAQGSGPTASVAVQEAMKLAILEVNGATIDSSSVAVKFGLDVSEGQAEATMRGAAFAEAIAQHSRGAISGFKLVSMSEPTEKGGLYRVNIEASIAKFHAPADSKKIKIVLPPLHSSSASFQVAGQSVPASKVASDIRQQLIDALTATGRFSVLDRDFGPDVQQELDLVSTGQTPNSEMAKLNQSLSADIVWVGTINNFAYLRTARKLQTSDRELVSYSGGWSLSQRILNVATRQILLSDTLQEQAPAAEPTTMDRGIDVTKTEASMQAALVDKVLASILSRTFPVTVLAIDGSKVVLSQGGLSVKGGARYAVVMMGKELIDPQTKQSLGRLETECCEVIIDKVTGTIAYAHIENPKISLASVIPGALQVRGELKLDKTALADTIEMRKSPTPQPAPPAVQTATASSPDDSKKW